MLSRLHQVGKKLKVIFFCRMYHKERIPKLLLEARRALKGSSTLRRSILKMKILKEVQMFK